MLGQHPLSNFLLLFCTLTVNIDYCRWWYIFLLYACLALTLSSLCIRMSELIEKETEEYRKGDPDPFDDRHPGEICVFLILALIFLQKKTAYYKDYFSVEIEFLKILLKVGAARKNTLLEKWKYF